MAIDLLVEDQGTTRAQDVPGAAARVVCDVTQPWPDACGDDFNAERVAHYAIRETRLRLRMAQVIGLGGGEQGHAASVGESLLRDFDDWRADRPSQWPWPRPRQLHAQYLLDFAAVLRRAASIRGPLQRAFQAVADHAHGCALRQMQQNLLQ